jgi:hypothetical protein
VYPCPWDLLSPSRLLPPVHPCSSAAGCATPRWLCLTSSGMAWCQPLPCVTVCSPERTRRSTLLERRRVAVAQAKPLGERYGVPGRQS